MHVVLDTSRRTEPFDDLFHVSYDARGKFSVGEGEVVKELELGGAWVFSGGAGGDGGTKGVAKGIGAGIINGRGCRDVFEELCAAMGVDGIAVHVRCIYLVREGGRVGDVV